jgi:hypothetical protein
MSDSLFLQYCPTSAKDMPPFNKSKVFTLSLQLSTFTFALLVGQHLPWEADFHKIKSRETLSSLKDINKTNNNIRLTESSSHSLSYALHTGT